MRLHRRVCIIVEISFFDQRVVEERVLNDEDELIYRQLYKKIIV
jgi:hypothetical protein